MVESEKEFKRVIKKSEEVIDDEFYTINRPVRKKEGSCRGMGGFY